MNSEVAPATTRVSRLVKLEGRRIWDRDEVGVGEADTLVCHLVAGDRLLPELRLPVPIRHSDLA